MNSSLITLSEKIPLNDRSRKLSLSGIRGSAAALNFARILPQLARDALVICPDAQAAQTFLSDLKFFSSLLIPADIAPELLTFPGWEVSPYSRLTPIIGNRVQRLRTIQYLANPERKRAIVVASVQAVAQPTLSPGKLRDRSLLLKPGQNHDFGTLKLRLAALGYAEADPVEDPGTFAFRGGIVDVYGGASAWPARIEFFGDEIEKIRYFNPTTQRTLEDSEETGSTLELGPLRELECLPEELERARSAIRLWCDSHDFPRASRDRIMTQLSEGIVTQEMDFLLPFFNSEPGWIWEHFRGDFSAVWLDRSACVEQLAAHREKLREGHEKSLAAQTIAADPEALALSADNLAQALEPRRQIRLDPIAIINDDSDQRIAFACEPNPPLLDLSRGKKAKAGLSLDKVQAYIQKLLAENSFVFFVANSQAQLDRMAFLLAQKGIASTMIAEGIAPARPPSRGSVTILLGSISAGLRMAREGIAFLSEDEVFGLKKHSETTKHRPQRSMAKALAQTSLDDLEVDQFLVHVDHGIGRYRGLVKLKPGGIPGDYVFIEYAAGDKLYLPIYRLEAIQKYVGAAGAQPALDRLGSQHFAKAKEKAQTAVKEVALGLLEIYARRAAARGYAFREPDEDYRAFEAAFPYDETPDQLKAINETIADMCAERPMDRLVCGDVGYGKTEVAMRAAFLAASEGKQVAVLVPTTVLAEQHLHSFRARFENSPIRIESLSRFRSRKEQKEILENVRAGKVDIVIGTHRLLSKDVGFKDLGLLIIDEEQRFGVEHKERLKKLRVSTDVLTLTATPIPRTLHFALLGIRDITIIHTPPADRLAIRTFIAEFNEDIVREAIENEVKRGGQVFFIHNRVQSIPTIFRQITEILPRVKVGVAHGQMPEGELEKIMLEFYQRKFDVLLCTSIIENGLDVPNANTIIVNRADTFGLSQLYQIRGRVGRSQTRAFAYLLLPQDTPITEDAKERLQVLQRHVELGSGFVISSHDLELRGAGDILGDAQSGHVTAIGYDLYLEMLAEEVARLKGEEPETREDVEISSPFPAFLPEDYVPDPRSRLSLYKRFSSFASEEEIEDGRRELTDRYGKIPQVAEELFWLLRIKLLLRRFGFKSLKISADRLSLEAGKEPKVDITRLLELIRKNPTEYSFGSDSKLIVRRHLRSLSESHDALRQFIFSLGGEGETQA